MPALALGVKPNPFKRGADEHAETACAETSLGSTRTMVIAAVIGTAAVVLATIVITVCWLFCGPQGGATLSSSLPVSLYGTGTRLTCSPQTETTQRSVLAGPRIAISSVGLKIKERPLVSAAIIASVVLLISAAVVCCVLFIPRAAPESGTAPKADNSSPNPSADNTPVPFRQTPAFAAAIFAAAYLGIGIVLATVSVLVGKLHPLFIPAFIFAGPCVLVVHLVLLLVDWLVTKVAKCGTHMAFRIPFAIVISTIYVILFILDFAVCALFGLFAVVSLMVRRILVANTKEDEIMNTLYGLCRVSLSHVPFLVAFLTKFVKDGDANATETVFKAIWDDYRKVKEWAHGY